MAAIIPIVLQLITLLPTLTTGAEQVFNFITSVRTAAQQTGEWTADMETAFLNGLIAYSKNRAWQLSPAPFSVTTGAVKTA